MRGGQNKPGFQDPAHELIRTQNSAKTLPEGRKVSATAEDGLLVTTVQNFRNLTIAKRRNGISNLTFTIQLKSADMNALLLHLNR